jgi:hypothetical protein
VPRGGQRDEGGEEARIMTCVHGQDPSIVGRQVETLRSQFFACIQTTLRD